LAIKIVKLEHISRPTTLGRAVSAVEFAKAIAKESWIFRHAFGLVNVTVNSQMALSVNELRRSSNDIETFRNLLTKHWYIGTVDRSSLFGNKATFALGEKT
jgi:hypothetical protein